MANAFTRPNLNVVVDNNTFMFGTANLSNHVVVESITRTLMPPTNVRSADIPGKDGQHFFDFRYGIRTINVKIRIVEETHELALAKQLYVANALGFGLREPKKLVLRDLEPLNKYNMAVLTSEVALTRVVDTLEGELIFTCYDPFNYNETLYTATTSQTWVSLSRTSSLPVRPKITLKFNAAVTGNVTLALSGTDQKLVLKGPFSSGATVIFEDFNLTMGGVLSNHKIDLDQSTFIEIPGMFNNTLTVSGTTSRTLTVSFREVTL